MYLNVSTMHHLPHTFGLRACRTDLPYDRSTVQNEGNLLDEVNGCDNTFAIAFDCMAYVYT